MFTKKVMDVLGKYEKQKFAVKYQNQVVNHECPRKFDASPSCIALPDRMYYSNKILVHIAFEPVVPIECSENNISICKNNKNVGDARSSSNK